MKGLIYLIHPGDVIPGDNVNEWSIVKPVKETFEKFGYDARIIVFGDYTYEQFSALPVPDGVVFFEIITFQASKKYESYLELIKTWDTVFLHDVETQYITCKKSAMYEILSANDVDVPKTIVINGDDELTEEGFDSLLQAADIQYPVVVKPDFGRKASMTELCYNYEDACLAIEDIRSTKCYYCNEQKKMLGSPALVQEYVGHYPDLYVRVAVLPGGYTGGCMFLTAPFEEEKFVNYNKYKFRISYKVSEELESEVKRALAILNVNAALLDLLVTPEGGFKFSDINCYGNLTTMVIQSGLNLYDNLSQFMDEKITQKRLNQQR